MDNFKSDQDAVFAAFKQSLSELLDLAQRSSYRQLDDSSNDSFNINSATVIDSATSLTVSSNQAKLKAMPDFEMHYDQAGSDNVPEILEMIQQDLSYSYFHDWDKKLRPDPVKALVKFVRFSSFEPRPFLGSNVLYSSGVDTICTVASTNHRKPGGVEVSGVRDYLFPSNVSSGDFQEYDVQAHIIQDTSWIKTTSEQSLPSLAPRVGHGRVA